MAVVSEPVEQSYLLFDCFSCLQCFFKVSVGLSVLAQLLQGLDKCLLYLLDLLLIVFLGIRDKSLCEILLGFFIPFHLLEHKPHSYLSSSYLFLSHIRDLP